MPVHAASIVVMVVVVVVLLVVLERAHPLRGGRRGGQQAPSSLLLLLPSLRRRGDRLVERPQAEAGVLPARHEGVARDVHGAHQPRVALPGAVQLLRGQCVFIFESAVHCTRKGGTTHHPHCVHVTLPVRRGGGRPGAAPRAA